MNIYTFLSTFLPTPAPPTMTRLPTNTTVVSPNPAIFTCIATGVPLPRISWMKGTSLTPLYTIDINTTITQMTLDQSTLSSTLTLLHPLPDDAAEYFCLASNEAGAEVASAVLTIHGTCMQVWYAHCSIRLIE